ncbi:crosslink repair DNA glycosylase YcaQ family protein [Actinopolymorpha sp. B9G3]|uniref:winged helix-turn-helix domain-containing protein n=1 Tax=Actinopolymorpha sp. B9G3 TaxID=3158970 RepID=UPI0032D9AB40
MSRRTRRRFVLGCQGLWPGRRATGFAGTRRALRRAEVVQVDPLNVVARSHDLVLHSRVVDYRPEYLDALLYRKREFFDYGGCVYIRPMDELPYVRLAMEQVRLSDRWRSYEDEHADLLSRVRGHLRDDGPLAARDFPGVGKTGSFRSTKDTSVALYYLWLTGEAMTYGRRSFERLYALRPAVAPPAYDHVATDAEADVFSAHKASRWAGLFDAPTWAARFHRRIGRQERAKALADLVDSGFLTRVSVEGVREMHYVPTDRLALLEQVEAGGVPRPWRASGPDTTQEAALLSPFDVVLRGPRGLFDFEAVFEAYKPAAKRRWGYYTMPVLYGDDLVARVDPAFDRAGGTLQIRGLWLETDALAREDHFVDALGAGLLRLARFVGADRVDVDSVQPAHMRQRLKYVVRR